MLAVAKAKTNSGTLLEMKADQKTIYLQTDIVSSQPISVIVGDRLCVHCGYNLTGQSIFRESHYDLLIARCPECGSVTSLHEYPSLGRWANRWAGVFAGLWVILLLAMWAGSSGAIFGMSMATAMEASEGPYREYIDQQYTQWDEEQKALAANNQPTTTTPTSNAAIAKSIADALSAGTAQQIRVSFSGGGSNSNFQTWWAMQDKAALIKQMGGWHKAVDKQALFFWILITFNTFAIGCFWGIALLKQKRRGLFIWAALLLATSCVFASFVLIDWSMNGARDAWHASEQVIAPPILALSLAYSVFPLFTGVMLGRPIARRLTKILLPPRLLNSLSTLWITDGLKPPSGQISS